MRALFFALTLGIANTVLAVNLPLDPGVYKVVESDSSYCIGGEVSQEKDALVIGGSQIFSGINQGKIIDKGDVDPASCGYETVTEFKGTTLLVNQKMTCPKQPIHFSSTTIDFEKNKLRLQFTDVDQGGKPTKTQCLLERTGPIKK